MSVKLTSDDSDTDDQLSQLIFELDDGLHVREAPRHAMEHDLTATAKQHDDKRPMSSQTKTTPAISALEQKQMECDIMRQLEGLSPDVNSIQGRKREEDVRRFSEGWRRQPGNDSTTTHSLAGFSGSTDVEEISTNTESGDVLMHYESEEEQLLESILREFDESRIK